MKARVLWIEDSARFELSNLTGPVYFSGEYDFQQAENITTAISFLKAKVFDILIVDVRLPPGTDSYWLDLYHKTESDGGGEKLGIIFLYWLLSRGNGYQEKPPEWVRSDAIAVFTVESYVEIREKLHDLGINVFRQKTAGLSDMTLIELIDEVQTKKAKTHS